MRLLASATIWLLAGCASARPGSDALCGELAAFANARAADSRTITLTTRRNVEVREDQLHPENIEIVFATKTCEQDHLKTGHGLCAYLLETAVTEFPEQNFLRAAQCMGLPDRPSPQSGNYLPVTSRTVSGIRTRARLAASYTPASEQDPAVLKITAD